MADKEERTSEIVVMCSLLRQSQQNDSLGIISSIVIVTPGMSLFHVDNSRDRSLRESQVQSPFQRKTLVDTRSHVLQDGFLTMRVGMIKIEKTTSPDGFHNFAFERVSTVLPSVVVFLDTHRIGP